MDLTLRHKLLYVWLLSFRSYKQAVSVSASLGTSYMCKHSALGQTARKPGNSGHTYKRAVS